MDPFSPDRPTATSDGDTSSVQNVVGVSESSLVVSLQSNSDVAIKAVNTSEEVQDVSAAGDNVERSDVALFGSVGLPGEATSSTLPGSGGSNGGGDDDGEAQDTIAMQKFVSLDIDEGIVKIEDSPIARERTGTGHESSEAYSDDKGGGEGLRSGGDNSDANTGSHVSAGSAKYAGKERISRRPNRDQDQSSSTKDGSLIKKTTLRRKVLLKVLQIEQNNSIVFVATLLQVHRIPDMMYFSARRIMIARTWAWKNRHRSELGKGEKETEEGSFRPVSPLLRELGRPQTSDSLPTKTMLCTASHVLPQIHLLQGYLKGVSVFPPLRREILMALTPAALHRSRVS